MESVVKTFVCTNFGDVEEDLCPLWFETLLIFQRNAAVLQPEKQHEQKPIYLIGVVWVYCFSLHINRGFTTLPAVTNQGFWV